MTLQTEAQGWATTIVRGLQTRFPWASTHVSSSEDDCDVTPWVLHPAFHGCLDWHSSCHMQWSAITLLELAGEAIDESTREQLVAELDERLTDDNCAVEAAYLRQRPSFERPYGWAWACLLTVAAQNSSHPHAPTWAKAAALVSDAAFANLLDWMGRLTRPVRNGQHDNTAFGVALCLDAARELGRVDVVAAIEANARRWFEADVEYPSRFEPSGNDFISPALCEAVLMQRIVDEQEFAAWLGRFLPELAGPDDVLTHTPEVVDLTDGKLVHLFGLALSRAWMLRRLAPVLDPERADRALASSDEQQAWAQDQINHGDFMSTHWLVSFAIQAELARSASD